MKFRKKPVVIEAFQWTGAFGHWEQWLYEYRGPSGSIARSHDNGTLVIPTLEGDMTAMPGDWIIKGVKGEVYPCKPDIFEATYEPVNE